MKKKKTTLNDIAIMLQRGFKETAKSLEIGFCFDSINKRFDKMDERFDRIEKLIIDHNNRIKKLEDDMKEAKSMLAIQ
ncbi:MAG: hypothetical protein WC386_02755 [Candidatus Paceibacterota bacterium]|jgi:wobble nucleotide-excising tRNase